MKCPECLEHSLETKVEGRKGKGRPLRRWVQDIADWIVSKEHQQKQQ